MGEFFFPWIFQLDHRMPRLEKQLGLYTTFFIKWYLVSVSERKCLISMGKESRDYGWLMFPFLVPLGSCFSPSQCGSGSPSHSASPWNGWGGCTDLAHPSTPSLLPTWKAKGGTCDQAGPSSSPTIWCQFDWCCLDKAKLPLSLWASRHGGLGVRQHAPLTGAPGSVASTRTNDTGPGEPRCGDKERWGVLFIPMPTPCLC